MITNTNIKSTGVAGRLPSHLVQLYYQEELIFGNNYCSCGTNVRHLLYNSALSVSKKIDAELGYIDWLWANERFITGMQYTGMTVNQYQKKWNGYKKTKNTAGLNNIDWTAALTPAIIIYKRSDVLAYYTEYHRLAKDAPTFKYDDQNEFLGEFGIQPGTGLEPAYIMIGKTSVSRTDYDLHVLKNNLVVLERKFPNASLMYFPEARLDTNKTNPRSTGTGASSKVGLKILQYFLHSYLGIRSVAA